MRRIALSALVVTPLLLSACHSVPHVEVPPVRPHVDVPEVPVRPRLPVPPPAADGEAVRQARISAEAKRLISGYTRKTITGACELKGDLTLATGELDERIAEVAGRTGTPHLALRQLVYKMQRNQASGNDVLDAAVDEACESYTA